MTYPSLKRAIILILFLVMLAACAAPGLESLLLSAAPLATSTPRPPRLEVPADATATPTPFQPVPPTAVYYPTEIPTITPTSTPTAAPTPFPPGPDSPVGALPLPPDQLNILLLGTDKRPWDVNFRTDTIMLVTLNPSAGTVSLVSFPRDLYINIPGWGMERINTAWGIGGFNKLADTFKHNFGVRPDHYVLINFSSFKQIIDSLGGLDVNVGTTVSDYRNGYYHTIQAGPTHMDADTVLWYVRTRKTTNDFARNRRQQEVLMAIFQRMLSLNALRRVPEFYAIYKDNVTTDLSLVNVLPLLPLAIQMTDTSRIHQYYIGPEQVYDWITPGGGMVLVPRQGAILEVVRQAVSVP